MMERDIASIVRNVFSIIIDEYKFRVVPVDRYLVLIIGPNFALKLALDHDSLDGVEYIERGKNGRLDAYVLGNLMMDRWKAEDSLNYGKPVTKEERIIAALRVDASGFYNRCKDLLTGGKSWLKRDQWKTLDPKGELAEILDRELPRP